MRLSRIAAGGAALVATVLGSGCASIKSEPMELDTRYIAYVEGAAKRYSTQVIWVNLPMRPVQSEAPAEPAAPPQK